MLAFVRGPVQAGGGAWMVDRFAGMMLLLIAVVYLGAAVSSTRYIGAEHAAGILTSRRVKQYYALLPLFVLAMVVSVTTDHLGILWIALEATTLATTPLVALYKKDGAIEAAWKYLLLCSVGISVSLLGLLLLAYAGRRRGPGRGRRPVARRAPRAGVAASIPRSCAGRSSSCSSASARRWASCRCTRGCPTPTAARRRPSRRRSRACCSTSRCTPCCAPRRWWTWRWGRTPGRRASSGRSAWRSILFAAFVLLHQQNYKRMLAYHSVEHMGLISFGLGMGPVGAAGAVMHMIGHTLAKSALFFSAGEILLTRHTTKIANIKGLWRLAPRTSLGFLLGFLGLIGAPTSIIFASELTFLMAAARRSPASAIAVIIGLAIVAVGVLHHVFSMLFGRHEPQAEAGRPGEGWTPTHGVVAVELVLLFAGGIFFLTVPGFELAASIAATFTLQP